MKNNKKLAFTLSEILIAIVIIGIVASLTIFFLSPQIEKAKKVAILKVAYSKLNNLVRDFNAYSNCNGDFATCFPGDGQFALEFSRYLVNQRGFLDTKSHNDWYGSYSNHMTTIYYWNPTPVTTNSLPKAFIAHGGAYKISINKNMYDNYYHADNDKIRAIFIIHVDNKKFAVDGKNDYDFSEKSKKKNILGKVAFTVFVLNSGKVVPGGSQKCKSQHGYYCTYWKNDKNCSPKENKNASGNSCLGRIIDEGWKITYY